MASGNIHRCISRPSNRSSVVSDGSGRDTYVVLDGPVSRGAVQGRAKWHTNFRETPAGLCNHAKGYQTWYLGTRPGQWSPRLFQPSTASTVISPTGLRAPLSTRTSLRQPSMEVAERTMQTLLARSSASLRCRTASVVHVDIEPPIIAASPTPHVSWQGKGKAPGDECFERMLSRAASCTRMRARPHSSGFSF
eukprot:TRINITY_DN16435_c0_g2_i1.p1 TRINITY_DN16435_c0_g2~~TRINITY_DN16435_c0_g2_i1.p1  ORF type:complete len:216 (-),score=18.31 TRINITY_DN16435_c0_g2_i1:388-966(-)